MSPESKKTKAEIRGEALINLLEKSDEKLGFQRLIIHGDGVNPFTVHDPSLPAGQQGREAQLFVTLPDEIAAILPGSTIGPEIFLKALGYSAETAAYFSDQLLSTRIGAIDDITLHYKQRDFYLNVLHGSTNGHAREISRLASVGGAEHFKDAQVRADYQTQVREIMKPVLQHQSDYSLRIVEDCIASGETIAGIIRMLGERTQISTGGKIRIDAAVATTQGILILKKFAEQNNLQLELNIGYLAYGLSEGAAVEGGVRAHANYITYPKEVLDKLPHLVKEEFESYRSTDNNIYVVGDMGDAAKSMSGSFDSIYSWNRYRDDKWGDRKLAKIVDWTFNDSRPTILYFANGGYLMRALVKDILRELDVNEIIFSAKRVWSDEEQYHYGVLIMDFPTQLLFINR